MFFVMKAVVLKDEELLPYCLQQFKAGCIAGVIPSELLLKHWKKVLGFVTMTTDMKQKNAPRK